MAAALAATVSVADPVPGAPMDAGENCAVTPAGIPVMESATAELKPAPATTEKLMGSEPPMATITAAGPENANVAACIVTVRLRVLVTPPPVAVTVMGVLASAAAELAETVRVLDPLPGVAMEAGENCAETPAGNPETDNATAELKPAAGVDTIATGTPAPPRVTVTPEAGEEIANPGEGTVTLSGWVLVTPPPVAVTVAE